MAGPQNVTQKTTIYFEFKIYIYQFHFSLCQIFSSNWSQLIVYIMYHQINSTGSGRVFLGFGIWPKYGAGIWKTISILTGSGIWLFPGKRDSPKIGLGMRDLCVCVSVGNAGNGHDPPVLAAKANQPDKAHRTTDSTFISCSFFILRYKKLFLFAEAFKNTRKFKISIERINLHLTFISFCRN